MNERIRELAEQAGLIHEHMTAGERRDALRKFELIGELIVRECMGVARGMRNPPNLNYKPSDRFVDELRLHFGVE
jgi:hypothetical protein